MDVLTGDFYDAQSKSASLNYHVVISERILMVVTKFAVASVLWL